MNNQFVVQPKRINTLDFLLIIWGCVMAPLWTLGFYQSFKEGTLEIQGLVMSTAALVVSVCLIINPFLRRQVAIVGVIFSVVFMVANLVYNASSIDVLIAGLVFASLFLFAPSALLLLSSIPRYRTQLFADSTFALSIQNWTRKEMLFLLLFIVLLLVVIGSLYGIGFTFSSSLAL